MRHATLLPPERPAHLPENAQWLAGEGAGSWFLLRWRNGDLFVERFSPTGGLECAGMFALVGESAPVPTELSEVTFPSHCAMITLRSSGRLFTYRRVDRS